jgi:aminopeptidase N
LLVGASIQAPEGNRDQAFIDMMHDFMENHHDSNASTEPFKAVVEKHMPKKLELQSSTWIAQPKKVARHVYKDILER